MTQLSSAQIDRQIDDLHKAIKTEEENHRQLSKQYVESGGDASIMERMIKIKNKIGFFNDTISANQEAYKVALEREEKEFDEEREEQRRKDFAELKKLYQQRVAIAKKLDRKFAELGQAMEEFRDISEQCHKHSSNDRTKADLITERAFNAPPQIFGWKNVIHKSGLAFMAGPNFKSKHKDAPYADASLADCIRKQHELISAGLVSDEEGGDV